MQEPVGTGKGLRRKGRAKGDPPPTRCVKAGSSPPRSLQLTSTTPQSKRSIWEPYCVTSVGMNQGHTVPSCQHTISCEGSVCHHTWFLPVKGVNRAN